MLFYGPSGAGKKTRIACTLRELFGKGAEKVRALEVLHNKPTYTTSPYCSSKLTNESS